jgi:S1-C subfamily serine protease
MAKQRAIRRPPILKLLFFSLFTGVFIPAHIFIGAFISLSYAADSPKRQAAGNDLVSVVRAVKPGVVAVGTHYFNDVPKTRFYGTGFVVGDGRQVVTNEHILAQVQENRALNRLRIFHPEIHSKGIEATVLARDETHDLALLAIQGTRLPPLSLGNTSTVQEGQAVAFTGYPIGLVLGLNPTTHAGIISAISPILLPSPTARAIKKDLIPYLRNPFDIFQIDATAYPGNSGSPLYRSSTGEVIGVINMVFVKGKKEHILKEPTGITYAIPIEHVKALMKEAASKKP